jgi:hypothetical protein
MEQKYFILLTAVIAAIAVFGIITMQLSVAVIAIFFVLVGLLLVRGFGCRYTGPGIETEGEAILAGVLIALAGMMVSEWIVWAAIVGILLITLQSVVRIGKRLDAIENR